MAAEYQLSLHDYISILRRRALLLTSVFVVILAAAVAVAILLPPVYESSGTILVESQRIPTELVQATVTGFADERIEVIKQRVMTRETLLRIADKYQVFRDDRKSYTPSELIDEMRSRIGVELVSADVRGRNRATATIAFKLSVEDRHPELAHRVANELVTLFLDENVKARTERANETTKFFAQEAERLKVELDKLENQVATFKQEQGNALPEHLSLRMNMLQRLEAELKDVEREYKTTQEELTFLEIELAAARAGVTATPTTSTLVLSPAQELQKLQSELSAMSSRFTENHPDLRALRYRIEELEGAIAEGRAATSTPGGQPAPASAEDLVAARVQAKIASANGRLTSLREQRRMLSSRMDQLEEQIIQAPQVERGLATLMRDHENARNKYEEVRAKQMQAQMAENLEEDNKAERFSLLEPPLMPDKPTKPNRKKTVALGFFLAFAGAGGLAMFLEALGGRVRGHKALTAVLRQPPLVIIPYISTKEELSRKKSLLKIGGAVSVAAMLAVLVAAHLLYMPLDLLVFKVLTRFE